jgi:hypothetical protein
MMSWLEDVELQEQVALANVESVTASLKECGDR